EDELRTRREHAREKNSFPLAAGHFVEIPIREIRRIAQCERLRGFFVVRNLLPFEAPKKRRAAGDDDVECAHRKCRIGILREISDALRILLRRPLADAASVESDRSVVGSEDARHDFEQRRFSRAVRTGERNELRASDRCAHVANGCHSIVRIRDAANIQHQRLLRSSDRKNGTPRIAVKAPTGSSVVDSATRDARSASTSRIAPPSVESGSRRRKSRRQINRIKCGTRRPTKPMMPLTATAAPLTIDDAAKPISLMRSTSTPCDFASSSPNASMRRSPAIVTSTA